MSRYGILISGSRIVATFALALLGTDAELFQGHPVGETHAGNCRYLNAMRHAFLNAGQGLSG